MSFLSNIISSILDEEKVKINYENTEFKKTKIDNKNIQIIKNKKVIIINHGEFRIEKQNFINLKNVNINLLIENDKSSIEELNNKFENIVSVKKDEDEDEDEGEYREIEKEKKKKKKKTGEKNGEKTGKKEQWRVGTKNRNLNKEFKKKQMDQFLKMKLELARMLNKREKMRRALMQKMMKLAMLNSLNRNSRIPKSLLKQLMKLLGKSGAMKLLMVLRKKNSLNKRNINKIIKQLNKMRRRFLVKRNVLVTKFVKNRRRWGKSIKKLKKIAKAKKKKIKLEQEEFIINKEAEEQRLRIAKLYEILDRRKARGKNTDALQTRINCEERLLNEETNSLKKIRNKKQSLERSL